MQGSGQNRGPFRICSRWGGGGNLRLRATQNSGHFADFGGGLDPPRLWRHGSGRRVNTHWMHLVHMDRFAAKISTSREINWFNIPCSTRIHPAFLVSAQFKHFSLHLHESAGSFTSAGQGKIAPDNAQFRGQINLARVRGILTPGLVLSPPPDYFFFKPLKAPLEALSDS